jgi:hypothetical protein
MPNHNKNHDQELSLDELLSRPIEFDTISHSLQILYYDAALVYLFKLRRLLSSPPLPAETLTLPDFKHICHIASRYGPGCLLLPDEILFHCQPAIEGFRITHYIVKQLETSPQKGEFIPMFAFGFVYWAMMDQDELRDHLTSKTIKPTLFKDADLRFSLHKISIPIELSNPEKTEGL